MKVRMLVQISGDRDGQPWPGLGEVADLPDSEGADMCAAGLAEPVVEDKTEKATAPDDAEKRSAGRRRKTEG